MKKSGGRFFLLIISLLLLLVVSAVISITLGAVDISPEDTAAVIISKLFGIQNEANRELMSSTTVDIIWNIRFPRVLMSMVVGGGLSIAGVTMQAVVRNPLANPYILGISSGGCLGAALAILVGAFSFFGNYGVSFGAFAGAMITSFFVFTISFSGQSGGNTIKLLLAGMAVNAICTAFTNFIIYMAKNVEGIRSVTFWTMGSLTNASWKLLPIPAVTVVICIVFMLTQFRILNTLLIGDEAAMTLGINVSRARKIYLAISAALTGVIVAVSGTIGFVGLVIPHIVRMMVGSDHRRVVPVSIIAGSIFMIWCDVISRLVLGNAELPIGIVTSMIGGPFFIWMMMRKQYGFGGE